MSNYVTNPFFESNFSAPTFPFIAEQTLQMSKDFHWEYADRRSLQEIVPGIYIGPLAAARDREALDRFGIKTLVAVRTQTTKNIFKSKFPDIYRYENLDIVEGSLLSALPRVKPFVDACLNRGEKILFYDETGNAKAAILVCSYLMETGPMNSQNAYSLVKSKRLSVSLNEHERYQLEEFETLLKARNSIVAHPYTHQELNRPGRRRKHGDEREDEEESMREREHSTSQDYRKLNPFLDMDDSHNDNEDMMEK